MSADIKLTVPASAEYILPIRLFISGLAARWGFDVGRIEDIKTTVSESCNMLIGMSARDSMTFFAENGDAITICASAVTGCVSPNADEQALEFSELIMESLCDGVEICTTENLTEIKLRFDRGE